MSDILRGVISILIFVAVVSFVITLTVSLFPVILVFLVAVSIYGALFRTQRHYYFYRKTRTNTGNFQPRASKPQDSSSPKMVEVEVRDSK